MSELNFRDFFGNGGEKTLPPIYVDNHNDPRLLAYLDSLNAYQDNLKIKQQIDKTKIFPAAKSHTTGLLEKPMPVNPSKVSSLLPKTRLQRFLAHPDREDYQSTYRRYNRGTGESMRPYDVLKYPHADWYNVINAGVLPLFERPIQPVVLNQNKSTVNTTKGKVSSKVIPNNVKGSKLIQVREEIKPKNTNFTVPNNGGYSRPEDYVEPIVEQNTPIQQPIIQEQVPVKQDFRQYMQPKGYSRQGQGSERQSESFYDANGKMTGQIIGGQYVPTEYGKFLQSGMTEDEYLNSVQKFGNGGKYSNPATYSTYEKKYNLPSGLLYNVARTESNFNPNARSGVGATGLMQFMPMTAKEFGIDSTNPEQSIDAAGKYLSQLIKQTGNVEDALRAYNWGIGNVQKWKQGKKSMPLETQQYVGKVLGGKSTPYIGGGLGKYFNQIEQDLSWRSKQIDQELEDEEIPQYSQEEAVADNVEKEDEEGTTEEQTQVTQEEYVPLNELSKLMTASRRNEFLDIIFANTAPSIEEDQYQYYA